MRRALYSLVCFAIGIVWVPGPHAAGRSESSLPPLTTLSPGAPVQLAQDLDVNVVLIGFEEGNGPQQIDTQRFTSLLPPLTGAVPDGQALVGASTLSVEPFGITFKPHYNVVHTPQDFDDVFFSALRASAIQQTISPFGPGVPPLPVVPSQLLYDFCNVSPAVDPAFGCNFGAVPRVNTRFITQNYFISAFGVEELLGNILGSIGIDTRKHTVVLINWWGRPDFVDHVYLKFGDVDVDTGADLGFYFRFMTSGWGGTASNDPEDCPSGCPTRRLMYLDVSASPVERLGNWDITSPDVRSRAPDGVPDERLPPIWEYGHAGFRSFDDLTGDLASKFVGDVFVQSIAAANPLYPPALSPPRIPQNIQLDLNLFDTVPGANTVGRLNPSALVERLSVLPYTFSTEYTRTTSMPSRLSDAFDCFLTGFVPGPFGQFGGQSCYGQRIFGAGGADLYAYFRDHVLQYLEGDADYEVPVFMFHVTDDRPSQFIGMADDTWSDRVRQSFVYTFSTPASLGPDSIPLGRTATVAHEVGHHLGLKHPHNAFICGDPSCVEPKALNGGGDTHYSWLADQQSTIMSYTFSNDDFGQFELDDLDRYLTFVYLNIANAALAEIAKSPKAEQVAAQLLVADANAAAARSAYMILNYRAASTSARLAYQGVLGAIDQLHIPFDSSNWQGDYRTPSDVRARWRQFLRDFNRDNLEENGDADFLSRAGIALTTKAFVPRQP